MYQVNVAVLSYHRQCKAMELSGRWSVIDEPSPYFVEVPLSFVQAMTDEERSIALEPVNDACRSTLDPRCFRETMEFREQQMADARAAMAKLSLESRKRVANVVNKMPSAKHRVLDHPRTVGPAQSAVDAHLPKEKSADE